MGVWRRPNFFFSFSFSSLFSQTFFSAWNFAGAGPQRWCWCWDYIPSMIEVWSLEASSSFLASSFSYKSSFFISLLSLFFYPGFIHFLFFFFFFSCIPLPGIGGCILHPGSGSNEQSRRVFILLRLSILGFHQVTTNVAQTADETLWNEAHLFFYLFFRLFSSLPLFSLSIFSSLFL